MAFTEDKTTNFDYASELTALGTTALLLANGGSPGNPSKVYIFNRSTEYGIWVRFGKTVAEGLGIYIPKNTPLVLDARSGAGDISKPAYAVAESGGSGVTVSFYRM